jgi:flagellar basal-body rod protein FlgB
MDPDRPSHFPQVTGSRAEKFGEHGPLTPMPTDRPAPRDVEAVVSVPAVSGDPMISLLTAALDGLSVRQRVIADNVANVDTPNFRATSVDFESSLRDAVDHGQGEVSAALTPTDTPVGVNGNNVDLRKEMLAATQTQYQYQLISRAVSDQFQLVKIAAS